MQVLDLHSVLVVRTQAGLEQLNECPDRPRMAPVTPRNKSDWPLERLGASNRNLLDQTEIDLTLDGDPRQNRDAESLLDHLLGGFHGVEFHRVGRNDPCVTEVAMNQSVVAGPLVEEDQRLTAHILDWRAASCCKLMARM